MDKQNKLYSVSGDEIEMHGLIDDFDQVTVTNSGYIITPIGQFIKICDDEIHHEVCNNYLCKYLKDEKMAELMPYDSYKKLTRNGHILYVGVRMKDLCYCHGSQYESYVFSPNFPTVTKEQFDALDLLSQSNYSRGGSQLSKITMCTYDNNHQVVSFDEGMEIIKDNFNKNK